MGTTPVPLRPVAPTEEVNTRQLHDAVTALGAQIAALTTAHGNVTKRIAAVESSSQRVQQQVSSLPSFDVLQSGTSTQLKVQASALPAHCGTMSYVADATAGSITFSWTGLQIAWPDGTITTIPDSSLVVTGLTPSSTYLFYPSYNTNTNSVQFAPNGAPATCPPGTGTPPVAYTAANIFAAAAADGDRNQSLSNGPISITMPASGTSSGTVGGK